MLQCSQCEFFSRDKNGKIHLRCDPFSNIKEPECLQKWQIVRLDNLLQAYHFMIQGYQKMAPMQKKIFDMMKREIDNNDQADEWKNQDDDEPEDENDQPDR